MLCKQCKSKQAYIQQADDSVYREVFCPVCFWKQALKYYNKKNNQYEDNNTNNIDNNIISNKPVRDNTLK